MPKTAMDYSKCSIYKIEHIDNESLIYVGHTTNFDKRKCHHKFSCYNEKDKRYNLKLYKMIRENGGWDMFRMIEIIKYPCNDKRQAEPRENEVMKELKANMNSYKSFLTEEELKEYQKEYNEINIIKHKEYYDKNKEQIREKHNEYNEKNKEIIKEYKKEYYEENKTKLKEYKQDYYKKNKEKIKAKVKEHSEINKEIIKEKLKAKIVCECGCEVNKQHIKRHQTSKKHIYLINKIIQV